MNHIGTIDYFKILKFRISSIVSYCVYCSKKSYKSVHIYEETYL